MNAQEMNGSDRIGAQSGPQTGTGTSWAQGALWKLWMMGGTNAAPRAANTAVAVANAAEGGSIYVPDAAKLLPPVSSGRLVSRDAAQWGAALLDQLGVSNGR